ncbi:MAG: MerC domain-containing protein [Pseudomonadales bacterium]
MNQPANNQERARLDTAAVILSGICMLHCLALPVVLTIFPIFNVALLDEQTFHLVMLIVILPISLVALTIGCTQHKDRLTIVLGTTGLGVLMFTAVFGHEAFGFTGERIITSIGGLILASAHIQNYRCCRRDDCDHEHS